MDPRNLLHLLHGTFETLVNKMDKSWVATLDAHDR